MDEILGQLTAITRGMWRHRWWGLVLAWLIGISGAVGVFLMPDRYEASARVFVDTQSLLKPLMSGMAVQPNVEQQVVMLSKTLISRPNVEKLIRMSDLDLGATNKADQERLIEKITNTISISGTGRDNLYTLSFRDPNPEKAKRVVQSLVSMFVESSMGDSRKDADTAKRFLNDQIKAYEAKLEEAENRLKEFKLRNIALQTKDGMDTIGRVGDISSQLEQARLELREAENARDSAKRQLEAEKAAAALIVQKPVQELPPPAPITTPEIDGRIEAQQRNLDALLQRFTEQHPDVVGARRMIAELEVQRRKQVAELTKQAAEQRKAQAARIAANPEVAISGTPAYQELSKILATAEVRVASLQARVGEYSTRLAKARESLKTAPQTEAELTQLNRDYAIHKKNYEDLVARRESATLSGDLESTTGIADFRLIDPPRSSTKPVAPNRMLLLPGVLVAALAGGAGLAFLLSQMRPVFYDSRSLRTALGLPVLGVVTKIAGDAEKLKMRRDTQRFALASSGLVGMFILGIGFLYFLASRAGG